MNGNGLTSWRFSYQKTSEVVAHTAETVANKWQDMRNSSLFKSFESKLGSAYTNVRSVGLFIHKACDAKMAHEALRRSVSLSWFLGKNGCIYEH